MKTLEEFLGSAYRVDLGRGVYQDLIPADILGDGDTFLRTVKRHLDRAQDGHVVRARLSHVLAVMRAMQVMTSDHAEELAHLHEFRQLKKARNADLFK